MASSQTDLKKQQAEDVIVAQANLNKTTSFDDTNKEPKKRGRSQINIHKYVEESTEKIKDWKEKELPFAR